MDDDSTKYLFENIFKLFDIAKIKIENSKVENRRFSNTQTVYIFFS